MRCQQDIRALKLHSAASLQTRGPREHLDAIQHRSTEDCRGGQVRQPPSTSPHAGALEHIITPSNCLPRPPASYKTTPAWSRMPDIVQAKHDGAHRTKDAGNIGPADIGPLEATYFGTGLVCMRLMLQLRPNVCESDRSCISPSPSVEASMGVAWA